MGKKHRVGALPATTVAVAGITLLDIVGAHAAPPPPMPIYSWTGFYIGAEAGGAWQNYSFGGSFDGFSGSNSSGLAGVFGGYNKRWGNWVIGGEANLDGLFSNNTTPVPGASFTPSIGWEAAIRLRSGYLFAPQVLVYGTVGPAWTNVRAAFPSVTGTDTSLGWTVGAGIEFRIAPNWSARVEYDFSHFSARPFDDLPTSLDVHAFKAGIAVPLPKGSSDR